MSTEMFAFLDHVVRQFYDSVDVPVEHMDRGEIEALLTDDGQRRLEQAERAAVDWGRAETFGPVGVIDERMLVTPHGLLYAAVLRPPRRAAGPSRDPDFDRPMEVAGRPEADANWSLLYYVATTRASFDPLVDRVRSTAAEFGSAAAVDSRFGHEFDFPWPLDVRLRRTLDSHEVLIGI